MGARHFTFQSQNKTEAAMDTEIINMEQKAVLKGDAGAVEIVIRPQSMKPASEHKLTLVSRALEASQQPEQRSKL